MVKRVDERRRKLQEERPLYMPIVSGRSTVVKLAADLSFTGKLVWYGQQAAQLS